MLQCTTRILHSSKNVEKLSGLRDNVRALGIFYRCRRMSSKTSSFGGNLAQPLGVAHFFVQPQMHRRLHGSAVAPWFVYCCTARCCSARNRISRLTSTAYFEPDATRRGLYGWPHVLRLPFRYTRAFLNGPRKRQAACQIDELVVLHCAARSSRSTGTNRTVRQY